jgi:hypothetical protein
MFKIFEQYPEALRTGFTRLRDRLEDDDPGTQFRLRPLYLFFNSHFNVVLVDPGVVSATVNVITELSRKSNPRNYLPLAPQLFELLTTSSNNWMLIKIIKLVRVVYPFLASDRDVNTCSSCIPVWSFNSTRATSGPQVATTDNQPHFYDSRHLSLV